MSDSQYEFVSYRVEDGVATLRLERPEKKNAINEPMRREIEDAIDAFEASDATVLVLAGTEDAFSAGTDIGELEERLPEDAGEALEIEPYDLPERVAAVDRPTIAMVNGVAAGGGCELALGCDVRIASTDARLGFPEITLGGFPAEGGTQRLPRETNTGTALFYLLTGELVPAERAREDGLVQEVHPPDALEERTREIAATIAEKDRAALVLAKKVATLSGRVDFERGLELEGLLANVLELTPERRARLDEFLEE